MRFVRLWQEGLKWAGKKHTVSMYSPLIGFFDIAVLVAFWLGRYSTCSVE